MESGSLQVIDPSVVEAASLLQEKLSGWRHSEAALDLAARRMPGFDSATALAKVVLINALYYTNVYAVTKVAQRFASILHNTIPQEWTPSLIEEMAIVELGTGNGKTKRLRSLASKFAHFFMDQHFPMYDLYAKKSLMRHTGEKLDALESYPAFCRTFSTLAEQVCMQNATRKLDRYLWVQGQFDAFCRSGKAYNKDLDRAFREGMWPPRLS